MWLFIAPGLYANEKKLAVPFVFFASTLFISGAAFSHYILFPLAWQFFASFSNEFLAFTPRVEPVWSLYVKLLLAMGAGLSAADADVRAGALRPRHGALPDHATSSTRC